MDRANSTAAFVLFCESLNLGVFVASFLNLKWLPNWPNSVTVMGTRALLVDSISSIMSSPESVTLDPLSVCLFLQKSPFRHLVSALRFF